MSVELKIAEINKIESYGISIFEFDTINWWPLIRIYLFQNHKIDLQIKAENKIDKNKLIYPKRILWDIKIWKQTRYQLKLLPNASVYSQLNQADTCFVTSEANYKLNTEGKLINRYLDPLFIDTVGNKVIFVRSNKQHIDYVTPDVLPTNYFELKWLLKKQFNDIMQTVFLKKHSSYSNQYDAYVLKIKEHLKSFKYFENFNFSDLAKWIDQTKHSADIATSIFKVIKPKQLIQYCYYFPAQFGYTLAANQLGIKTVDYQHGIQNAFHYGYGSWSNVPQIGYELLPNEFWVYSKIEEQNLLKSFSGSTHAIKVIGNKWVKYWQNHKTSDEALKWLKTLAQQGYKLILFTVSDYLLEGEHFFWEYLKTINANNLYILFRLHPGHLYLKEQLTEKLKSINYQNYNIDNATTLELYDLLDEVDIHITQNSTVAEEALFFDLATIILDEKWRIYFEDHINAGDMYLPINIKDFDTLITKMLLPKH